MIRMSSFQQTKLFSLKLHVHVVLMELNWGSTDDEDKYNEIVQGSNTLCAETTSDRGTDDSMIHDESQGMKYPEYHENSPE